MKKKRSSKEKKPAELEEKYQWMLEPEKAPPKAKPMAERVRKKRKETKPAGKSFETVMANVFQRIPLFQGLPPSMVQKIMGLCALRSYEPEAQICAGSDRPSEEMYILLHGRLAVMTAEGMQVATLEPIATVCEMGFIIEQPRSAIVKAIQASNVLIVPKPPFDLLLQSDRELQARIYQNVTKILSSKLFKDNVRIRDHLVEKALFEKRLKEQRRRAEIALDLLVRKEVMTRDEAEMYIAEELGDASLRVLIVDDEPAIRRMVKDMLSSYEVVEAADGEEALQMADEQALDLVITDIKMPKMDGFALVTQLRDQHPNLRILGLSGYVEEGDVQEYDFDGFVKKPISLEEFRNLVAESLVKEREDGAEEASR